MSPDGSAKTPPPEERLLRLIRGKGRQPAPGHGAAPAVPALANAGAVRRSGATAWARWPQWVGGILVVLLLAEVVGLVAQVLHPLPAVTLPSVDEIAAPDALEAPATPPMPSLAAHASQPLFASPPAPKRPPAPRQTAGIQPQQLAARLTLLGIVSGDPSQAIIEDSQTNKTFFVTEGQTIVEGAVVKTIRRNRVVLDLLGEAIDLTL